MSDSHQDPDPVLPGSPTDPDSPADLTGLLDPTDPGAESDDGQADVDDLDPAATPTPAPSTSPDDVVQAVADFVDDLVEGPDTPAGDI